ncbi:hypothetical protein HEK131_04720 [Streptomyces seoulensis]|nr:hypothetical protein HEK131_04720 [Streptomyces seoulensis]
MRHTVRRTRRGVEQAGREAPVALRAAARTARSGDAPRASPVALALAVTRIPHKVPERSADSGP